MEETLSRLEERLSRALEHFQSVRSENSLLRKQLQRLEKKLAATEKRNIEIRAALDAYEVERKEVRTRLERVLRSLSGLEGPDGDMS